MSKGTHWVDKTMDFGPEWRLYGEQNRTVCRDEEASQEIVELLGSPMKPALARHILGKYTVEQLEEFVDESQAFLDFAKQMCYDGGNYEKDQN